MNTNIHEWRILKIKIEIRVHSCSFVAKMERLNTHTEIAIIALLVTLSNQESYQETGASNQLAPQSRTRIF